MSLKASSAPFPFPRYRAYISAIRTEKGPCGRARRRRDKCASLPHPSENAPTTARMPSQAAMHAPYISLRLCKTAQETGREAPAWSMHMIVMMRAIRKQR